MCTASATAVAAVFVGDPLSGHVDTLAIEDQERQAQFEHDEAEGQTRNSQERA